MSDSLADLHERVTSALRDTDALGLDDVGIALDAARLHLERRIVEAQTGLGQNVCGAAFDIGARTAQPG